MEIINYTQEIKNRIRSFKPGYVFTTSDFSDLGNYESRKKILMRLVKEGLIRRILRGVFEYPEYSEFLKEYMVPSPDDVAKAIARQYGWSIIPYGETALNMLGLSTQVPAIWCYISDGAYRSYTYDNVTIEFKKATNKEISNMSYETALTIQALKTLGKDRVNSNIIHMISSKLKQVQRERMCQEARFATYWIYDTIKAICAENEIQSEDRRIA